MRKCWSCMTRSPPSPGRVAAATVIQRKFRERRERPSPNENKMRILWVVSKSPYVPKNTKTQNLAESILRAGKLPTSGFNRRRVAYKELNMMTRPNYAHRIDRNLRSNNKETVLYALIGLYMMVYDAIKSINRGFVHNYNVSRGRRWLNRIHTAYRRVYPGKSPSRRLSYSELYKFFQTLPVNNLKYISRGVY